MKVHLLLHFRLNLVKQLQKSGKNKEQRTKTSKTSMKKTRSNVDVGESRG
jgi:hypothetical protein